MEELMKVEPMDAQMIEGVLLDGDLSKLTPAQRVSYYMRVCNSLGLNPLTKPFDYIRLNNKLTLYPKKDATDQLRNINGVSIDDVDIVETDKQYIVKVKGHNKDGRTDVEVGVVNKTDMQGNTANAQMKAVTKGKRRLTLSLCGLGWLDETEIETIPDARPVKVNTDTGEIIDATTKSEPETVSQETDAPAEVIEYVDPMGDKAVAYAAKVWNMDRSKAAQQIAQKKLGKRILWTDFVQIINPEPQA